MTDAEREAHIEDCGRLMLKAYREGDADGARHWLEMQNEAVRGRSPERVEELERCYFCTEGERCRAERAGA